MRITGILTATAVMVALAFQVSSAQPNSSRQIITAQGGFAVLMPDSTTITREVINLGAAGGNAERVTYVSGTGNASYQVSYFDYADSLVKKVKADTAFLNSGRDGFLKSLNGKLMMEKNVKLGWYTGRDLTIEASDGALYRIQVYMVNRRFYQVTVVVPKGKTLADSPDKFFDSFMLVIK